MPEKGDVFLMLENVKRSFANLTTVRGLVLGAMLLALYGILGTFKIPITPDNRITMTFAATSVAGFVLGPIPAMLVGGLGDILGYLGNTGGAAFFPGFTVSAMLSGLIYGFCLYKKPMKGMWWRIILAVFLITLFVNLILNTFWMSILYQKAYAFFAVARIVKNLIAFPVHVVVIYALIALAERSGIRKKYL